MASLIHQLYKTVSNNGFDKNKQIHISASST